MAADHVPPGFHTVTPFLTVDGAARLVDFLLKTFDAREEYRAHRPDGTVAMAQVRIEGSMVEINDARPEAPALRAALHVFVPDVDATYARALASGAEPILPPADMVWGHREAAVRDPSGTNWYIGQRLGSPPTR